MEERQATRLSRSIQKSFSSQLILIVTAAILIPIFVTFILSYILYQNMMLDESRKITQQQIGFTATYLENSFDSINNNLTIFASQGDISETFFKESFTDQEICAINESLTELCYVYPHYSNAYLCFTETPALFSAYSESGGKVPYDTLFHSDWFANIERSYDFYVSVYPFSSGTSIACVKSVRNPSTFAFSGYYMVKLKASFIDEVFSLYDYGNRNIYCITRDGRLVTSKNQDGLPAPDLASVVETISENPGSSYYEKGDNIIFWRSIRNSELLLVSVLPARSMSVSNLFPYFIGLLFAILFLTLSVVASSFIIRRFVRPVNHLAHVMKTADLDHLTTIPISGRIDEIGTLEKRYNDMVEKFNELLETQYRTSISAKEAQIRSLQLQINPHFVNNTLQMIGTLAAEKGMMQIYELIRSFSNMFYYCLKFKGNVVTFRDEMDYLSDYLKIQRGRFPDKFIVQCDIDPKTEHCEIPKMVLQPLVENCFKHSFVHMKNGWKIHISSKAYNGYYKIIVTDNGRGICAEQIAAVQAQMNDTAYDDPFKLNSSIGLQNVNTRIRLLYGPEYRLLIQSYENFGTDVILRLPMKTEETDKS